MNKQKPTKRAASTAAETVTKAAEPAALERTTPETASTPAARPADNIKFAGRPTWDKGKRKKLVDPQPIERFTDAGRAIELPPAAEQSTRRWFYHPDADLIVQYFPKLYRKRK